MCIFYLSLRNSYHRNQNLMLSLDNTKKLIIIADIIKQIRQNTVISTFTHPESVILLLSSEQFRLRQELTRDLTFKNII